MATGQSPVKDHVATWSTHDPEVALQSFLPLFIGIQALDRRLVALDVPALEQLPVHELVDRLRPVGGDPDPVGHRLPVQRRSPLRGHRLQAVQRQVMLVLGDDDVADQPRRGIPAHADPRQGRGHDRRLLAVRLLSKLGPHELALHQARPDQFHLKGALLADLLVLLRRGLHLLGQDLHRLHDRQVLKHFRRHCALLGRRHPALITHPLLFQSPHLFFRQAQLFLERILHRQLLALRPKHLLFVPRHLELQLRHLRLQGLGLLKEFFGRGHALSRCP